MRRGVWGWGTFRSSESPPSTKREGWGTCPFPKLGEGFFSKVTWRGGLAMHSKDIGLTQEMLRR